MTPVSGTVPFWSTVTGGFLDTSALDAGYWYTNLRQTVEFRDGVEGLLAAGHGLFVEVSSHPVLVPAIEEVIGEHGPDLQAAAVGTLRRGEGGLARLTASLGQAFVHGAPVAWPALFEGTGARRVDLPTYAFQHRRFWLEKPQGDGGVAVDPVDEAFWRAVEHADVASVSDVLGLDGGQEESLGAVLPVLSSWRRRVREDSTVDGWRYRTTWKPAAIANSAAPSGKWLVVTASEGDEAAREFCLATLGAAGVGTEVIEVDATTADRSDLAARLAGCGPVDGVLSLLASAGGRHVAGDALTAGLAATVVLAQALGDAAVAAPLWVVTHGAVVAGAEDDRLPDPEQAQLWGLGRVAALEYSERWGGLVDVVLGQDDEAVRAGLLAALAGGLEDQVAVRGSGAFVPRLAEAGLGARPAERRWRPSGTVLVTGGTGALGGHVARWLAGQGAEHLLLVSRRGPQAPGADDLAAELSASGAKVTVAACDLADRDAVRALVDGIPAEYPLTAVMHTAVALDDGMLDSLTLDRFDSVLRSKATSAWNLHEATRDHELSAFVLFSSLVGTLPSLGQANYAPTNTYLDALAELRRAGGLTATSVAWGAWGGVGLATGAAVQEQLSRNGIPPMAPDLGIKALQQALDHDETAVIVADVDWERLDRRLGELRSSPLVADLPQVRRLREAAAEAAEAAGAAAGAGSLAERLRGLARDEQDRRILDLVRAQVAGVLGHESADFVQERRAFKELGFDSLTAVQLRNRLAAATGTRLPATLVFDYPTPEALAQFLGDELLGVRPDSAPVPAGVRTAAPAADEPIAIVGMSCRFPGGVRSPEELWRLVADGVDAVSGFPADRGWDLASLYDPDPEVRGKSYACEGAFLQDAEEFDPGFFGISPREALAMDPQQRLLLETSWEVFERAGIAPDRLKGSATGVFIGTNGQSYVPLLMERADEAAELEGYVMTGNTASVMSGRVSYVFGLEGPAVTVDTACSSSLVALHLAAQALRSGECDLALAGGVTVMSTPGAFVEFSRQRGLAADGRCKAFADAADGTGWGEGVGVLLVERLSDAVAKGHNVLAVVRGSAVNQDGASNGLTAPNGPSQQRVIRQALTGAGLTGSEVDVVEAHGTGTRLGDPIEAQALLATYGRERDAERPLWLGSLKSNIGHTQAAAGVAGVIKMVMAMREGVLPQTLHVDEPSTEVDWSTGAVQLLTENRAWPQVDRVRRAGVSSFGVSGTNAHVILEQAEPSVEAVAEVVVTLPAVPVVLSGKSVEAVQGQAAALLERLGVNPELGVLEAGFSLATSRSVFEHRAAVVAGDREELLSRLADVASGSVAVSEVVSGRVGAVFSGQGSQWPGMGGELSAVFPVFARAYDEVCAELGVELPSDEGIHRTGFAQPAIFALEVALFRLFESWGVSAGVLAGHSVGEIAAAHVAGVLSLADACALVVARGRLMQALPEGGAMVAVGASEADVRELLDGTEGVWVAAVNGPSSLVISGHEEQVLAVAAAAAERGFRTRRLTVSHAFHSGLMDPMLEEFGAVVAGLELREPVLPLVSTVTGRVETELWTDPGYWVRQVREGVRFADAVATMLDLGTGAFLEVGPDAVLSGMVAECLPQDGPARAVVPSLRRDRDQARTAVEGLARLHAVGTPVAWETVFEGTGARRVDLPTYAFQRRRYWLEASERPVVTPERLSSDVVDGRFWEVVERGDLAGLSAALGVGEEQSQSLGEVLPVLSSYRQRVREQSAADQWRYRITWEALAAKTSDALQGRWIVVAPEGVDESDAAWVDACVSALRGGEREIELITLPLRALDRARLAERLAGIGEAAGVLSLLALDERTASPEGRLAAGVAGTLLLVQALGDAGVVAPVWAVTRGAVSVGVGDRVLSPVQAQVWGLGRVAALEHPELWGGLVDLPEELDAAVLGRLSGVLAGFGDEDQVALRASGAFARRLVRALGEAGAAPVAEWRPSGTVLVTGGTGALGGHVARWLAGHGAEHLLLVSRRGSQAPGTDDLAAELSALGAKVTIAACDIADRAALAALLDGIPAEHPLTAVVHAAGVSTFGNLTDSEPTDLEQMLSGKAVGAAHLDELLGDRPLDAFVLFSSNAGVWGSGGQGAYAAANAYLDALAESRRQRGLAATSIAWGVWRGEGMGADGEVAEHLRRRGLVEMAPESAVAALVRAVGEQEPCVTVSDVDWQRFAIAFTSVRPSSLITGVPEAARALAASVEADRAGDGEAEAVRILRERVERASGADRRRILVELVRQEVAVVLGHGSGAAVDPERGFTELGFDSLTAVELRNRLQKATAVSLPATAVFDYPTTEELAEFLRTHLAPDEPAGGELVRSEIDRIDAVLSGMAVEELATSDIEERLENLLAKVKKARSADSGQLAADRLDEASDDEIFDIIGKRFGIS
ncbi:type I polyketide synthase [Kitasatospora sp. NPDC093806]|uniref:type I polyketide synthase n=1 Tax=Kitasatospora sp. NPDC093806 TaxID=3155075 RepID=UPI00344263D6